LEGRMMREKLLALIKQLDPDLHELVAEVIEKEREYIDLQKPRGVKEDIRDLIEKHAKFQTDKGDNK
jgi:hypothetical protein